MRRARAKKNALSAVASVAKLRRAWLDLSDKKVGRSRNTVGVDGQSINQFAQYVDDHLRDLSGRLQQPTPYEFSELKPFTSPKASGNSYRVICVPTVRDRIVQRAILTYLTEQDGGRYSFDSGVSFGFIKNKWTGDAISTAIEHRNKHPWAFKADIRSFFDAIQRPVLLSEIRRRIPYKSLHGLLAGTLNCEARPESRAQARVIRHEGIQRGRGVRQGMPLSPYFANIMLAGFDKAAITTGLRLVRYADDFVCFGDSEAECREVYEFCADNLQGIGLRLHELGTPGKCSIVPPDEPVEFLGVLLTRRPGNRYAPWISDKQINERKAELSGLGDLEELVRRRLTLAKFVSTLDSKIAGWLDAFEFCENLRVLDDTLRDLRRNVLEKVLFRELGITAHSTSARQFLGLEPFK